MAAVVRGVLLKCEWMQASGVSSMRARGIVLLHLPSMSLFQILLKKKRKKEEGKERLGLEFNASEDMP